MWHNLIPCLLVALAAGIAGTAPAPAAAAGPWQWSYGADGISACGTFASTTGTPIPGNEPYSADNLVGTAGPQLTGHGFGFALADGSFANPFSVGFRSPESHLEFFTAAGVPGRRNSERPATVPDR
jgi:hypothetical protein